MFDGFFEGKTALVTGVAGVKGTWLALQLLEAGCRVVGIDSAAVSKESNFYLSGLRERITFIPGDINDLALLQPAMDGVDCVFHLAAVAIVGDAHRHPLEAYRTNCLGTATVLDAFRTSPSARWLVCVTTDKVYHPKDGVWVESDPLVATGPYAVSKACAEFVVADYFATYFRSSPKKLGVGRAGNVLVGGDLYSSSRMEGAGRIAPDCFEALIANESPVIFNPEFTRPFTYGLDVVAGYAALMSHLDRADVNGEAFNFGPWEQAGIPNRVLATKASEAWGSEVTWKAGQPRPEPFDLQAISWEKARRLLGWQPAYLLTDALRDCARWYREWARQIGSSNEGAMYDFDVALVHDHREAARRASIAWAK